MIKNIKALNFYSKKISKKDILLLWQFTLNNLEKIDIIKNQYQFIEMFLIRTLYLKKILIGEKKSVLSELNQDFNKNRKVSENKTYTKETIDQLKNIEQKEKISTKPEIKNNIEGLQIKSFSDLIKLCEEKKEIKFKYELENNLRLVSFMDQKIEISFNSVLDKTFIKDLTAKLLEWTNKRWIIAFSKEKGAPSLKEEKKIKNLKIINEQKKDEIYKKVTDTLNDAELIEVEVDEK